LALSFLLLRQQSTQRHRSKPSALMELAMPQIPFTNCVRLQLDESRNTATALLELRQELEKYGDICRVERLWPEPAVTVTFYDRRAAASAKAEWGDACSFEAQEGCCSLHVEGKDFGKLVLSGVSDICSTSQGGFCVSFFDTRDALEACQALSAESPESADSPVTEKVQLQRQQSPAAVELHEALWDESAERAVLSFASKPRYVHNIELSQSWEQTESKEQRRSSVMLRGLPVKFCQRGALMELLRSHGMHDLISGIKVQQPEGKKLACAELTVFSPEAVPKLTRFFHGKQFPGSKTPVAVSCGDRNSSGLFRKPAASKPSKASLEPRRINIVVDTTSAASTVSTASSDPESPRGSSPRGSPSEAASEEYGLPPGLSLPESLPESAMGNMLPPGLPVPAACA